MFILLAVLVESCNKQDWLDVKSSKADLVPKTIQDFQAILDNDKIMNSDYPAIGILGCDNYYVTYTSWLAAFNANERNAYIWAPDIWAGSTGFDWNNAYRLIAYANIVLEGITKIHPSATELSEWNNAKGSALFYRAYAFYDLAQLFAKPWDSATAATDPGIPLRLTADVNVHSTRSTLKETYDMIIKDLKEAESLLPQSPLYVTRPSKTSVEGLLARVFFNQREYDKSLEWSDKYLDHANTLIDFNSLDPKVTYSLPNFQAKNKEITFYAACNIYSLALYPIVDTTLYRSYDSNDLRRSVLYKSRSSGILFLGSYTGSANAFDGVATNEILLINAESKARMGYTADAVDGLNSLLIKRYATGTFIPYAASDADEVINKIIEERRKELPFTGSLRWQELRRLNKEPARAITLTRLLNGQLYTLLPNDNRYVYPIPPDEIQLSRIAQNPR